MLRILPRSEGSAIGVELSDMVTKKDYANILIPAVNRAIAEHGAVRMLFDFAEDFSGYEFKAMIEDARYSLKHAKKFEKIAAINAPAWISLILKIVNKISWCRCRSFDEDAKEAAWGWIEE